MEVDVGELEKLISLAELVVDWEKRILRKLERSFRDKNVEVRIAEEGIEGLEKRREPDREEKQLLGNEIGKLELVREDIEKLRKKISYWNEKMKKDGQLLRKWKKRVGSAVRVS